MAWCRLPLFDDELKEYNAMERTGYCRKCKHKDCEEVRKIRETPCNLCNKEILPYTRIYYDENNSKQPQHAFCVEESIK